jgi:predicted nucleic acid-binding protein
VALAVFDADVLIGFLDREDAHHGAAVARVRHALERGDRRAVSTVNLAEVLVGPTRAGTLDAVGESLRRIGLETVVVDRALAERSVGIRAMTGIFLPDAFALATALDATRGGAQEVRLETFDRAVVAAARQLGVSVGDDA